MDDFARLRLWAEAYEDAQKTRIGMENRLRSMSADSTVPEALIGKLREAEKMAALTMRRTFRKAAPEIREWVMDTPGLGEHAFARLLGTIGHPVIAQPYHWEGTGSDRVLVPDPPYTRTVSQLWAYCGHGDPARRKRKGMTAEEAFTLGNPRAKMIVHLIAECAMKCVGSAEESARPSDVPQPGAPLSQLAIREASPTAHPLAGTTAETSKVYENLLRRCAQRQGTTLAKSRVRDPRAAAYGTYRLGDIVGLTLEQVAIALGAPLSQPATLLARPTERSPVGNPPSDGGATPGARPNGETSRRRSPYRDVYELGRARYADREAEDGTPWTLAHQHAAALRLTGKRILQDLYDVAKLKAP